MTARRSSRLSEQSLVNGSAKSSKTAEPLKSSEVDSDHAMAPPKSNRSAKRKVSQESRPSTPKRRNKATEAANLSDLTPKSSTVKVISEESVVTPKKSKKIRRADPHATNAPLQTPGGSRVVKTYEVDQLENLTPRKIAKDNIITTDNLLDKACEHLCAVDSRLHPLVKRHTCQIFTPEGLAEEVDPFVALSSSIISQQVSGAAAASIKRKFIGLFPPSQEGPLEKHFPSPAEVAKAEIEFLRTAGLSQRKAEYIKGLAEKFSSGELSARMLIEASDEELFEKLIAVRGLGRWSVEMFACFALKRMDIFSTGDLGVQRGMASYVGKDVNKLKAKGGKWKYMSEQDMLDIANRFAPYRSLFMWYMWRVEDVNIEALEQA